MSISSLCAGIYSLFFCIYVWITIALFLTENHFNPIQDVFDDFFPKLEEFLFQKKNASIQEEKFNETDEDVKKYVENIRVFCPSVMIATLVMSIVYAISTILMIIGISTQKTRGLVLPYLVLHLFLIIVLTYNNIFLLTLTLPLMPLYHVFSTHFFLPILFSILLANLVLIYNDKVWEFSWLSASFAFIMLYYIVMLPTLLKMARIIGFQTIFQYPLPMCLIIVWKDFVNDELEKKDVR